MVIRVVSFQVHGSLGLFPGAFERLMIEPVQDCFESRVVGQTPKPVTCSGGRSHVVDRSKELSAWLMLSRIPA